MLAKFLASWFFKALMWALVGVGTLLVALGVGLAFLVCVPVVVGYSLWEFFIGRHQDSFDAEVRKMLAAEAAKAND